MEIERKFIIDKEVTKDLISNKNPIRIVQKYLYHDPFTTIRKRKYGGKYFYTIKSFREDMAVNEFEKEITKEKYKSLKKMNNSIKLVKDRYRVKYSKYIIEIDIFKEFYDGLFLAEIEFDSIEEAQNFIPFPFFIKELTTKYSNYDLAVNDLRDELINSGGKSKVKLL